VQVLEGLETYIATEDFLHKLEQASAEWIDLSEHDKHQQTSEVAKGGLELTQVRPGSMLRLLVVSTQPAGANTALQCSWVGSGGRGNATSIPLEKHCETSTCFLFG
jgi:hypothetical protein